MILREDCAGTAMVPVDRLVNGWFRYVELQRAVIAGSV